MDRYTVLEISEKPKRDKNARSEFLIAYAVESDDIPRFKEQVTISLRPKEALISAINDAAFTRLEDRREKAKKEREERSEQENQCLMRDTLKAELDAMKGTEIELKKPEQKKKQLKAPKDQGYSETGI